MEEIVEVFISLLPSLVRSDSNFINHSVRLYSNLKVIPQQKLTIIGDILGYDFFIQRNRSCQIITFWNNLKYPNKIIIITNHKKWKSSKKTTSKIN